MRTPADLHAAVLARLQGLTVAVYDSTVPGNLPADSGGQVYPYAVLWPSPGFTPGEARNLEHDASGGLVWDARVTVASGHPTWTLQAVHLVRARLDNWPIIPGHRLAELEGARGVEEDTDTSPSRWFVPLTFRVLI